jgi:hypothetical protein
MKKRIFSFLCIASFVSFAQNNSSFLEADGVLPCYTDHLHNELLENPEKAILIDADKNELETFTQFFIEHVYNPNTREAPYVIPIVFHVLHTGGIENISDEQIYDAVTRLNEDFNKQNNNWMDVNPAFLGIVADVQVEFRLAKKKNNGDCFKGITRTQTTAAWGSGANQSAAVEEAHGNFPSNRYLNIFVVPYANGSAGYTNYPNNWGGTSLSNGIYILHTRVGRFGTSNNSNATTLAHEAGHWFNLRHLWGNSNEANLESNCNIDDDVNDTPNTRGWTTCNVNGESCGSLDNVENFLEYSGGACRKMFTDGQKARMHAALNATTGGRNNLHTETNLNFTGVYEDLVFCRADFRSNTREVCPGSEVLFIDESIHSTNEWTWSFEGGTPETSSEQNPVITYSTPGQYTVTLTSSDGIASDTKTFTNYITVLPQISNLPFLESFENTLDLNFSNTWSQLNYGGDNSWELFTGTGFTGNNCVRIANLNESVDGLDDLISHSFDLSNFESNDIVTMSFRTSFKRRTTADSDRLRVYASTDCGLSWATRRTLSALNLSVGDAQSSQWIPSNKADWKTWHLTNINQNYFSENVRFKFEFRGGGGNNIYLDDINLYAGVNDPLALENNAVAQVSELSLYPNPTESEITLDFFLAQDQVLKVRITDLSGKEIQLFHIEAQSGENTVFMSVEFLSQGMYLIEIISPNGRVVKPFAKS